MKYRLLLILSCLLSALTLASAQERVEKRYSIYFGVGKSGIDTLYMSNGHTIRTMTDDIKATLEADGFVPDSLLIYASTSPEGPVALNERLAQKRAANTRDFILAILPELKDADIKVESRADDWSGLIQSIRADETIPYRDELLKVLTDSRIVQKELVLRQKPHVYAVIRDGMFDKMRTATVTIRVVGKLDEFVAEPTMVLADSLLTCSAKGDTLKISFQKTVLDDVLPAISFDSDWLDSLAITEDAIYVAAKENPIDQQRTAKITIQCYGKTHDVKVVQEPGEPVVEPEPEPEPVVEPEPQPEPQSEKKPFYIAAKSNMLYDLAAVPNAGAEFYLGKNLSIAGNWMYAWWKSDKVAWYWRTYGGDLALRYWFGKKSKEKPLQGHHLGIYGQGLTYDFEVGSLGYLADKWTFGGGVEYGYSLPIAKLLNIDFNIGVGYIGGEFKEYLPIDGHYVWQATKYRHWLGPTKAEISLVWLLGRGNVNEGKGGAR